MKILFDNSDLEEAFKILSKFSWYHLRLNLSRCSGSEVLDMIDTLNICYPHLSTPFMRFIVGNASDSDRHLFVSEWNSRCYHNRESVDMWIDELPISPLPGVPAYRPPGH